MADVPAAPANAIDAEALDVEAFDAEAFDAEAFDADDHRFMQAALAAAEAASAHDDVPVGAVVVHRNEAGVLNIVATGENRREADGDPTAHAEVVALRRAAEALGTWRLTDCTLYVTLEPCFMCAGAVVNARVGRVVFGAHDPKAGAAASLAQVCSDDRLNHRARVDSGLCAEQGAALLRTFFKARRKKR